MKKTCFRLILNMQAPPNFIESLVNKESVMSNQSESIKINLKPHQLAMIYRMSEFESHKSIKINGSNGSNGSEEFYYKTKIGFLCDKVGSGKSLTILGLISLNRFLKPSMNFDSISGLYSLQSYNPVIYNMNIITVPHGIFAQWQKYIEDFTTLNPLFIRKKKEYEDFYTLVNSFDSVNDFNKANKYDIILVSSSFYNKVSGTIGNTSVSRLIVDEVDMINVSSSQKINAEFTWFVSSSINILRNPNGYYAEEPYTYTNWQGQIVNTYRHVCKDKISKRGYFKNVLIEATNSQLKTQLYLRSEDSFIEESFRLPEIKYFVIRCKNTIIHNVLNGIVSNDILNMINAGDIHSAIQQIGCETLEEDNLINIVTRDLKNNLNNKKLEYQMKSQMVYASASQKETALTNIREKITELESKIEDLKERITDNSLCCICYDEIDNKAITKCCNNSYCFECITLSISHRPKCPYCRADITHNDLIVIKNCHHNGEISEDKVKEVEEIEEVEETDESREKIDNFKIYLNKSMKKKNSKILVFSEYEASFKEIKDYISQSTNYRFSELKGTTTSINKIVKRYKLKNSDPESIDILLLNANYFGSGLNLENTSDIFLYHKMNESMTNQIIGRAQRPGRSKCLKVLKLCYENETD